MRILHVRTVNGTGGGPDKTILKSCEYLVGHGHAAEAFYMLNGRNDMGNISEMAGKLKVRLTISRENGPISVSSFRALSRVLKTGNYDIVHTHEYKSTVLVPLFRRRRGFKTVATAHGYNCTSFRELFYYGLERFCFKFADAVIAPSNDMVEILKRKGVCSERLHQIPNGIETEGQERPVRNHRKSQIHLLYLGRLSKEKDPMILLEAMETLRRRGYDCGLILAGDGPERKNLQKKISERGLTNTVKILGYVKDIIPVLNEADILVNPSRTECMPNSILEAMWSGLPVVATAVGGVGEMIRDSVDGLLCPPGDPAALANAVVRLIEDPSLARRMADSAYQRVMGQFTFEKHMASTLALYSKLLSS
jgi:glycosyltransferase involved in cell wall biosynthesis